MNQERKREFLECGQELVRIAPISDNLDTVAVQGNIITFRHALASRLTFVNFRRGIALLSIPLNQRHIAVLWVRRLFKPIDTEMQEIHLNTRVVTLYDTITRSVIPCVF